MIKRLLCLIILLCISTTAFASDISDPRIERAYDRFITKVDAQLTDTKKLILLEKLGNKIDIFFDTKKLSDTNKTILYDLNKLNNEELASIYLEKERAEVQSELFKFSSTSLFSRISVNKENIFLENGVWYFYDYKTTRFFETDNVDKWTLSYNNINPEVHLTVLRENWKPWFVTDFQRVKLISDDIIFGIPDKYEFLKELKNDQRHIRTNNTDEVFRDMKNIAMSLDSSWKKSEKIASVYAWMLDNLVYTENIDLEDRRIFSWSETYRNRDWVCEWYTKVMMYMLNFLWVRDSVVVRWDVIDAVDFPLIWHAWVRVWQDFYDPTFDDPIGARATKTSDEYKYFKLPKDLMYTNRFDLGKTPKALESTSLEFREDLVGTKLFALSDKYNAQDYPLLLPSEFRKSIGLDFDDEISFDDLKKKAVYLEVGSDFSTILDGRKRFLQWFQYFAMPKDGSNVGSLLNQLDYDLTGYYFMKFYRQWNSWEFDYRLAYNVDFR